jgi:hypothetical protein
MKKTGGVRSRRHNIEDDADGKGFPRKIVVKLAGDIGLKGTPLLE